MRKLISILVATVFAFSSGFALAASHTGAQPMEKSGDAKKSDKKKKSSKKKEAKKSEPKKDEMKK
jgi:ribosomal protein L12E/L44/L45/RPP1/RPP2